MKEWFDSQIEQIKENPKVILKKWYFWLTIVVIIVCIAIPSSILSQKKRNDMIDTIATTQYADSESVANALFEYRDSGFVFKDAQAAIVANNSLSKYFTKQYIEYDIVSKLKNKGLLYSDIIELFQIVNGEGATWFYRIPVGTDKKPFGLVAGKDSLNKARIEKDIKNLFKNPDSVDIKSVGDLYYSWNYDQDGLCTNLTAKYTGVKVSATNDFGATVTETHNVEYLIKLEGQVDANDWTFMYMQ